MFVFRRNFSLRNFLGLLSSPIFQRDDLLRVEEEEEKVKGNVNALVDALLLKKIDGQKVQSFRRSVQCEIEALEDCATFF